MDAPMSTSFDSPGPSSASTHSENTDIVDLKGRVSNESLSDENNGRASAASILSDLHLAEASSLSFPRGSHIKTWSGKSKGLDGGVVFEHHGIYVSDTEVIHYTREHRFDAQEGPVVEVTELDAFGTPCCVHHVPRGWQEAEETVARARSQVGTGGYKLLGNNCEHFATWCRTGVAQSEQVSSAAVHSVVGSVPGAGLGGAVGALLGTSTTAVATVAPAGSVCIASGGTVVSGAAVVLGSVSGLLIGALIGGAIWTSINRGKAKEEEAKTPALGPDLDKAKKEGAQKPIVAPDAKSDS